MVEITEATIAKLDLKPGDVLVLQVPEWVDGDETITPCDLSSLQRMFPNNRVVVLNRGIELKVVRSVEA